jgi:hypothetical protein
MLEYYKGVLFLTTNRVSTFDQAFESRIHLKLHYPDLNIQARKAIVSRKSQSWLNMTLMAVKSRIL